MRAAAALGYQPVGDYATTVIEEVRWLIDQYRMNPDAQLPAGLDEEFFTGSFDYAAEDFSLTAAAQRGSPSTERHGATHAGNHPSRQHTSTATSTQIDQ